MATTDLSPSTANAPEDGGAPADTGRAARVGLWTLALGFGGFLLWAGLAPLDEGVPTQGTVMVDTKRKTVQHLSGGVIQRVLVREGEFVDEGQLLIELDASTARANFEAVRQRYLGLRAVQGRLEAEQIGSATITFHPDLVEASADPLIRVQMDNQGQLLHSRRAALNAALQAIEESIRGQEALVQTYQSILTPRRDQLALLTEELKNTRGLVEEGYAPRNRQLELERQVAESNAAIAELMGNSVRAQRAIAELHQQAEARRQEYRKDIETELTAVLREVQSDAEKLIAVRADLERTEIRSPVAGQVIGLDMQTVGGVVQPGHRLMYIVPEDAPLLLETKIEPHLIDKVRTGLITDVRFNSFSHSPQLVVEGEVISVSNDLLTEQVGGGQISYYLARVQVTPEGLEVLGSRRMQPGMPVEVIIKTGERSMLTYLLNPLTKRLAASMKEE